MDRTVRHVTLCVGDLQGLHQLLEELDAAAMQEAAFGAAGLPGPAEGQRVTLPSAGSGPSIEIEMLPSAGAPDASRRAEETAPADAAAMVGG